jgi:uncharacterized protein (TIGR02996 family)
MNHADGLLANVLEHPDDQAPWLVLADWLEEQGDPASLARAELLRLQPERTAARDDPAWVEELDQRATAILQDHPGLLGALQPFVDKDFPVLSAPAALVMFLLADQTSVIDGHLAAGSTWEGELKQRNCAFPTTLVVRQRTGNHFEGDMKEDFSSMLWPGAGGTFYFRGVVLGRSHVAFVTYRMEDLAAGPGLYQFRLNRLRRLNGTWLLPGGRRGKMKLKLRPADE